MNKLLALLLAFFVTTSAFAQTAPQDVASAKKHFDVGLKLYGEHAYAEALAEFDLSYKLGGRPNALKNVAQCQRDLKHFAAAYDAFDKLLVAHVAQLSEADKSAVKRAMEELAILTGTISVSASVTAADVEIDGNPVGQTPLERPRRVALGAHKVKVTKAGFEPFEKEVSIGSEQALVVEVKLEAEITSGHVAVREEHGRDVHLFVDGEDRGALPWTGDLPPGEHVIEARGPKFAVEKRTIAVARKERLDVVLDATPTMGHLRVTVTPAEAKIRVDGAEHGTGNWEGDVSPGSHRIVVSLPGYPDAEREVTVERAQLAVAEVPLVAAFRSGSVTDYRGVYGRFNAMGDIAPSSGGYQAPPGFNDNATLALGFGAALRVGYAFDWWGLEVVGVFAFLHRDDHVSSQGPSPDELVLQSNDFMGIFGIGPRVTSKHDTVRFTFGVAPGFAVRAINFSRKVNCTGGGNCSSVNDSSATAGYVSPALVMDGGMLIGSTPGAKFFLGVHAWLDLSPTIAVGPDLAYDGANLFDGGNRGWTVHYGSQFFFGPVLGVQFGH